MYRFALTGVGGYVAPRHLLAIKDTGNELICALDPHDSVGILDHYFPKADYFSEFERFERHISKLSANKKIDYLSICSPNYLHDTHIRLALRNNSKVVCEKPLVLTPYNLDALEKLEEYSGNKIFTVMQLRYHPSLLKLKEQLNIETNKRNHVKLSYITSRGNWYNYSWKGNEEKSGGIATNIGIHLFDLLLWFFGHVEKYQVTLSQRDKMAGNFQLKNADIEWLLSIDSNDLPKEAINKNKSTFRSITINDSEIEFSDGFTDLHTKVYQEIFAGRGLGINDARPSIELVYKLRTTKRH